MASTYLTRTMSSNSNQKVFTLSVWLKRASLGRQVIMGVGGSGNYATELYFQSGGQIDWWNYFNGSYAGRKTTTRLFRDTNAWYHIVARWDTTDSTAANRMRLYINGVEESGFATSSDPSLNQTSEWNSASAHEIGRNGNSSYCFDGAMSHIHFVDGSSLAPSVFGSTDSTTGEWKINTSPSFTPGSNGFTILKDGNTVTDQSANSNDFSVSAGTLTKTEDCPSNIFATGNPHVWTSSAWSSASLTNGNNTLNGSLSTNTYAGCWSSLAMPKKGKFYAEFKITAGTSSGGNAYVGITTPESLIETSNASKYSGYANMGGTNGHEYAIYGTDGQKYVKTNGGSQTGSTYGSNVTFGTNDIICVACDLDNNKLYFRKNADAWMNSGNPESGSTGTGALSIINHDYHMFICDGGGGTFINADANFGNGYFGTTAISSAGTNASNIGIFEYDVPAGYTALCTKGLNE